MINIFDNYFIFGHEDLFWYCHHCKSNDKITLREDLVMGENGIIYCDYFTMCHLANNLSDSYKMIEDYRDFEINYGTNWVLKDTKLFPGYFKEWILSMEWIYNKDPNFNWSNFYNEYWETIIGEGVLLKTWISPNPNDNKTYFETIRIGKTISFCKDSKYSMSFDSLPMDYLLPIILKKIK